MDVKAPLSLKLLLAVAVLGFAAFMALRHSNSSWRSEFAGGSVFQSLEMDKVASISIAGASKSATLALSGGKWTVADRLSHPANAKMLSKLLSDIAELKCARPLDDASDSELEELGLGVQSRGLQLKLLDSKGAILAALVLGRPHMKGGASPSSGDPDGRYCSASVAGGPFKHFLTGTLFEGVGAAPGLWLEGLSIDVSKVCSVAASPSRGEPWTILRASPKDQFSFPGPSVAKVSPKVLGELMKALSNPPIFDLLRSDVSSLAMTQSCSVTVKTFDGQSCEMLFGFSSGKCVMKIVSNGQAQAASGGASGRASGDWTYETSLDFAGLFLRPPATPAN